MSYVLREQTVTTGSNTSTNRREASEKGYVVTSVMIHKLLKRDHQTGSDGPQIRLADQQKQKWIARICLDWFSYVNISYILHIGAAYINVYVNSATYGQRKHHTSKSTCERICTCLRTRTETHSRIRRETHTKGHVHGSTMMHKMPSTVAISR